MIHFYFSAFDARILFLYLPIGVLITVNVVLFSTTSCRLRLGKKNTDQLQTSDSKVHNVSDRHRYSLNKNCYYEKYVYIIVTNNMFLGLLSLIFQA